MVQLIIKFTKELKRKEGRGWQPGGVGGIFPFEVIEYVEHIGVKDTLALVLPTRLVFEDQVVGLTWDLSEKSVGVCVHTSLIAKLTLQSK